MTWEEIKRDWDEGERRDAREDWEMRLEASRGDWFPRTKQEEIEFCWRWYDHADRPIGQRSGRRR
jgi:hypothetical protein